MKKIAITACLLALSQAGFAAGSETITGRVMDGSRPVSNLQITTSVPGQKTVVTNRKGNFQIKGLSSINDTIYMGLTPDTYLEIPLLGATEITVQLWGDTVFVQREKKEEPPAVSAAYGGTVITRQMLEQTGEQNLLRAVSMKATGVEYVSGNLQIRGIKSLNMNETFSEREAPLYLVNGVETRNVAYLTVNEVETVEIVKDSNTAIFGMRGGNGVVVINLRK